MKILFVSRLFPHSHGISGSLIIYNRIRFLVECGHKVGLISFVRPTDKQYVSEIKPLLQEMELLPAPQTTQPLKRVLYPIFSSVPAPFHVMRSSTMRRKVGEMIEKSHYHVAIAEFSAMGQYLYRNPCLPAVRRIVSCHECCTTAYLKAIYFHGWTPRGLAKRIIFNYVKRYEFSMYNNMDHILVLTPQERYALLKYAPNLRISVVPHGVDVTYYLPAPSEATEENILFVGYYPNEANRDAVIWFVRTVWPRLKKQYPNLKFYVVGRGPTPAIWELGRRDSRIIVTGEVDDIRPYLAKARVFICPVRMGSGFRAKLLEAMASGIPVVSTSLGAEGIPAWGGDTLFLADTPRQMLKCISLLLSDKCLRQSMAKNARELVKNRFSRKHGITVLENIIHDVVNYE